VPVNSGGAKNSQCSFNNRPTSSYSSSALWNAPTSFDVTSRAAASAIAACQGNQKGKPLWRDRTKCGRGDANTSHSERSTGDVVREAIERDGSIRIGLTRGLINERALARYIQKITHERYTFEALLSAIRRYPVDESAARRVAVGGLIRKLAMKNEISVIHMRNSPELQQVLARLAGEIDHASGETFRAVSTTKAVKVEIDSKNAEKLTSKLQKRDILLMESNLAEVAVDLSDIINSPGVLGALSTELAINDVNILEASGIGPIFGPHGATDLSQIFFIVEESDALRAYQALQQLREEK